jgi:hypothetical protein
MQTGVPLKLGIYNTAKVNIKILKPQHARYTIKKITRKQKEEERSKTTNRGLYRIP